MQKTFDVALEVEKTLSNAIAKSQILAELAKSQVEAGLIDDAFATIAKIPNPSEKRNVLFSLALDSVQKNKTEHLLRFVRTMVEANPKSSGSVGRLAQSLLDVSNLTMALGLVRAVEHPFDLERNRYDFVAKFIELAPNGQLDDARKLIETIADADYHDWALLAFARRLAAAPSPNWAESEKIAASFAQPRRQSWAFYELSCLASSEKAGQLLNRAGEIIETIPVEKESAEQLSIQLRILGKAAFKAEKEELGAKLLERSEAAAVVVPMPMQRFHTQYCLAGVLKKLGQIDSVQKYIDSSEWEKAELSGIDQSRVLVWLAEAEATGDYWAAAIRAAAQADNESAEIPRAERIVEILKRFSHRNIPAAPTGEPETDAINLTAEEFEEYYFSAFTTTDCGC